MHRSLPFCLLLFHDLSAVLAQLQIPLKFYTDHQCQTPSTAHAAVSVPLSECIVTPGLGSISLEIVPCMSGNVQLVAYKDTSCSTQLDVLDWYSVTKQCSARFKGDTAAILVTCSQTSDAGTIDPGTPTSTSTIVVAPVADAVPTATQSVGSNSPSVASSPSHVALNSLAVTDTSSGGATATQRASSSSPSSSSDGGSNGTGNSTGGTNAPSSSSSSRLSTSDIISITVGLGVGIPTILVGLWGLRRHRKRRQR